jgi:UDP-N-acetylmuramate: L-alanyl-gamma-D-glutamyl-meso-diaminopimelate ligase
VHLHILGICGTFMGGIAALARAAGHTVTGSDQGVYPPMSLQLEALGIELIEGFDPQQLVQIKPDQVVVGNVMSRGMPIVEALLDSGMPYCSGPAWLAEHVLRDRWVIAVSGTHGKTTTASMTAWILECAGRQPGFLIGGVPANFSTTARLGDGEFFVIEADEYDTAFFDKRAKFLHYGPRTLIINNLEFDHADIYQDMAAIHWQFHQMLRILPGVGRVIANAAEPEIDRLLDMGCWTPVERYSSEPSVAADWHLESRDRELSIRAADGAVAGPATVYLPGTHNAENATAAVLAACHAGVDIATAMAALQDFRGVKRRLELLGEFDGVCVYDDFAHHPTAIRRTLEAARPAGSGRLLAVIEPRSNSMKLGAHRRDLPASLSGADRVWAYQPADLPWSLADEMASLPHCEVYTDTAALVAAVAAAAQPQDIVMIMSNGGFEGVQQRLCAALRER